MTYKTKFIIFLITLHLAEGILAGFVFHKSHIWFIASESLILLSIILSIYFYFSFTKPLYLINSGIESIKDKDFNMRLVKVGQPELDMLIEVYNQMIDKLRYERTLQQEQHFLLELLLKASPSGIIILDPDELIQSMNPAAEEFLGIHRNDFYKKSLASLHIPLAWELAKVILNETTIIQLSGLKKYKVSKSYFVNQGFRNQFLIIEEFTNEIYKTERAAYEKVIRTISHEFNNSIGPINSILDSLNYYSKQVAPDQQLDYENAIKVAIDRNNSLNGFIKNYAAIFKLPAPIFERCNLNELIQRIERIFHLELQQRNINLRILLENQEFIKEVDVNQFEMVITNILKNAMEAIDANGTISILTQFNPDVLTIQNNGLPIPLNVQKQLFSPFFTTKITGQGIGLTLVREVLQNHDLKFSLQSFSNDITEFKIYF